MGHGSGGGSGDGARDGLVVERSGVLNPGLVTIAALVLISGNRALTKVNTPACIGRPFVPDR